MRTRYTPDTVCKVDGCDSTYGNSPRFALGMCGMHYTRVRNYGDPYFVKAVRYDGSDNIWCPGCKQFKYKDDFGDTKPRRGQARANKNSHCKLCSRKNHVKRKYNISWEQCLEMADSQDYHCANPGCDEAINPENLGSCHIDHDHACCQGDDSCGNCVRGILCVTCNVGAGNFSDDSKRLRGMADYLESFSLTGTNI
jgi:hypothetical protein